MLCAACAPKPQTEYVYLRTELPPETLRPCPVADHDPQTQLQLVEAAIDWRKSADCNKGKLETVAKALRPVKEDER